VVPGAGLDELIGGVLPAVLLCAALGLALAFAPRRTWAPGLLALAVAAGTASFPEFSPGWREPLAPGGLKLWLALVLSANAGVWTGLVGGEPAAVLVALSGALLCLPGKWIVARGWGVAPKVLASWLAAVALLAAALPTISTPSYEPDHMD
jgi:hypothetical protein